jgi:hypothetical protein
MRTHTEVTTLKVADTVGCRYRTAYAQMNDPEESGDRTLRKVGNRSWLPANTPETSESPDSDDHEIGEIDG